MAADLRASGLDLRRACDRLIRRGVLTLQKSGAGFVVALPIFREWLGENALSKLLPLWTTHASATLANKRTLRIRHLNQSTPVCFRFQKMTCSLSPKASSIVGSRRTWPTYGCGCGSSTTTDASKLHSSSYAVSPSEALSMKGRELSDCRSWRRWSTRDGATSDPVFGKLFAIAVITWHWVTSIPSIRAARRQRETCRRVCGLENVRLPSN